MLGVICLMMVLVGGAFIGGYALGRHDVSPSRTEAPPSPPRPSPYQVALGAATAQSAKASKAFEGGDWATAARQYSLAANSALVAGQEELAQECFYNAALAWERTGDWDAAFYAMERAGDLKGYLREKARGMADKLRYTRRSAPPPAEPRHPGAW